MNTLIALIYFVLSLYGIDIGGSTLVHRAHVDGADTLYSRVVAHPGQARFECLRSASGRCYYTLVRRGCDAPTRLVPATPIDVCRPAPVARFAVAPGDSRKVTGLERFHVCVSTGDGTPAPMDCIASESVAAR